MAVDETVVARKRAEASGLRGVYYDQRIDKFIARSRSGGKATTIGAFDTASGAAEAYVQAKPMSKSQAKLMRQAEARPGVPALVTHKSTIGGIMLWSFVPEYLRPRLQTEALWSARVWHDSERVLISVWQETSVIWEALAGALGRKPDEPKPSGHDYDALVAVAIGRGWPSPRLPRSRDEAKQATWRRRERVKAWMAQIQAQGLAQGGLAGVLATALAEEAEEALAGLIFTPSAPRVGTSSANGQPVTPQRPKGLGFIPAERSGLTREQTKQLMDDLGMDHVAFSAHVNAMVKETGITFGPMVRRIWEGMQTV